MRRTTLVLAVLMIGAGLKAASALSAENDMAAWAAASAAERSALVEEFMSKGSPGRIDRSELLKCIDQASSVSGHHSLPISEIAEACLHPSGPGDQALRGTAAGRAFVV